MPKLPHASNPALLPYSHQHPPDSLTPLLSLQTPQPFLTNYHTHQNTNKLLHNLHIFILPTLNPHRTH
ncbi:M14 family zinc carboxypeptidase, partial [Siminovitchia fortis]|uniref:M14 family zinc carboxypeptidase n=1 Tax=Siminovitchia fortis TaxID=254758 RepID=UPI0036F1E5BF